MVVLSEKEDGDKVCERGVSGLVTREIFVPDKVSLEATAEAYMCTPHKGARAQHSQGRKDPRE